MSTTSNLGTILRFYANRQESAFINYRDFCEYLKKYSARHLEEQPDLVKYIENPVSKQIVDNYKELTEEEKRRKTEELFMQLELMETNFNMNKKDDSK